jgi:hypothetical protein
MCLLGACSSASSTASGSKATGATTTVTTAGDKTAFCADNAILDKAGAAANTPAELLTLFKGNVNTLNDFDLKAPAQIKADADALTKAATAAIAAGDASNFAAPALQTAGSNVDSFCGQNSDGTPASGG